MLMLGMPASWALAMQSGVSTGTLMATFWLSPLLILAFGRLFLGERAAPTVWLASGVGCAGALLLTHPGPLPSPILLVLPLAMAVCFSLYVVMTRSLRSETTRANLFYTAFGVFVVLTPLMPHVWLAPSPHDLAVLIGVGLLGYLTLFALDRLAAAAPVSVAAPLAYLQLAFALVIAVGMGSHGLPMSAAAGLLLIVGAAVCLWARAPHHTVREAV
jgi:drug/metabolite transporter (DMT)-like permease